MEFVRGSRREREPGKRGASVARSCHHVRTGRRAGGPTRVLEGGGGRGKIRPGLVAMSRTGGGREEGGGAEDDE